MSFPSPNFTARRGGLRPEFIILHYTGMTSCAAARARLCLAEAEVSAHWLISETGEAEALVAEDQRAWHAGAGSWRGLSDLNSRSIGIELANPATHPFPEPQMAALEDLLRGVMARWQIGPEGVIGHSDMAPGRKIDPGPRFDWLRLARQGLALWPGPVEGAQADQFDAAALAFGYPADVPAEDRLAAFRLRFRPFATGPVSDADAALALGLQRPASFST
ncbi:N-acetylmuramoyl-L-alanine amidase [Falsigemmobacter faecalis]|uniref:N-acetylmuramoyl-L-alanine amidase n=1 Tax=Falsigemmobacter faecalis TaxID=2488730 RepID=A0A3P3D6B8_9RHOB|nr:N-acetylmuramoyl-L-alanine amidase [Falsigemmobacter faecalis]RRH69364.1 N-acetylmuramoyl-L-alanine amidase [Falsigemmobacter faecalis]